MDDNTTMKNNRCRTFLCLLLW